MKRLTLMLLVALVLSDDLEASSTRHTVIISDLHFGVGKRGGDGWLPTEDFRWTADLNAFLDQLSVETGNSVDLVIAGDLFELWQPLVKDDCEQPNHNLGCSESEAKLRITRVLGGHRNDIDVLAGFAKRGSNRLEIVPGNHDSALFFADVQQAVIAAFGDAAPRVQIVTTGYWLSEDRKIVVEHGQQIGRDVNRFDRWPDPFLGPATAWRLQKTWGEQFVQSFYNQYEERYPLIDNIGDDGGIAYGLAAEGLRGIPMAAGKFLRFYLAGSSWAQFSASLGGAGDAPLEWDVERIRAEGDVFFYESIPTDDPLRPVAQAAYLDGTLGLTLSDLSAEEIRSICDSRLALFELQTAPDPHPPPTISRCSSTAGAGAGLQAIIGPAREKLVKDRAVELLKLLRETKALTMPFDLYVYGHTHSAWGPKPIEVDSSWTFGAANCGAWQRIVTPPQLKQLECGRPAADVLRSSLDRLPACYPLIWVKPYTAKPSAALAYWVVANGNGSLAPSCSWTAPACH